MKKRRIVVAMVLVLLSGCARYSGSFALGESNVTAAMKRRQLARPGRSARTYLAHGLVMRSEVPLPELLPADRAPDVVTVVLCTDTWVHRMWVHDQTDLFLVTSEVAACSVRAYRPRARVEVVPAPARAPFARCGPCAKRRPSQGLRRGRSAASTWPAPCAPRATRVPRELHRRLHA